MACEVNIKDIQREIKQELLGIKGIELIPKGNSVFEKYTKYNPDSISNKLIVKLEDLNRKYASNKYGKIFITSKEEYGTRIEINPSQELADAMTLQNIRDEVGDDFYMGDDALRFQEEFNSPRNISYVLKAVDILSSDKAKQVFAKGQKNNWSLDKILTELQVPKEQKQIILDKGLNNREEIITSLLADNSFVVEINQGKEKVIISPTDRELIESNGKAKSKVSFKPSQYYSNLTVPGGTNYTENEIATPDITPNIKGHAQFATDNGIGWFRSDDKADRIYNKEEEVKDENGNILVSGGYSYIKSNNKARRILEIQSDLFQKGRNLDILQKHDTNSIQSVEEADKIRKEKDNQFLQLLNKDNNWVTFFVKSIIQDTAKQTITEVQESDVEAKVKELEKDGLLEIDCKGKLKAEKGLQTNFTKGGKWKLIKDLKGYPTHKEGGVDLTIGKNGVSIKNGNTEFTAKHGLVIPKN